MRSTFAQAELNGWERTWRRSNHAIDTFYEYRRQWKHYETWCEVGGLQSVSRASAEVYIAHLERLSGYHTARLAARAIKNFGKYWADEYDEPSPFKKLKLPKEPAPQHAPTATDEDLSKLLAACEVPSAKVAARGWESLRDKAIITTLALTGMRRGEVASMRLDEMDLGGALLRIPHTKNGEPRLVGLHPDVVSALLRYLRACEVDRPEGEAAVWLSAQDRRPLQANGIGQMIKRRSTAAGVDVGAHAFRRRYAGQWMAAGGSETGLMTLAGWKSPVMIARYTKDTKVTNAIAEAQRLFG